jgi:isopenicillin N synthase-like dioxygenase
MAETGVVELDNDAAIADAYRSLFTAAHQFFNRSDAERELHAANSSMTGWRRIGIEYSQSPDRPDLNETFCYRRRDDDGSLQESELLDTARALQDLLDPVASGVLASFADRLGVADRVQRVRTRQESWLQINYSRPSTVGRDFIQEAHEDGHLITILAADAPGLEVYLPRAGWTPVLPSPERTVCFAGECGALLTGDLVTPMPHQVRAHPHVTARVSVAYFVNPDLDQDLPAWASNRRNAHVDLLRWGQENPARFGLPTL